MSIFFYNVLMFLDSYTSHACLLQTKCHTMIQEAKIITWRDELQKCAGNWHCCNSSIVLHICYIFYFWQAYQLEFPFHFK